MKHRNANTWALGETRPTTNRRRALFATAAIGAGALAAPFVGNAQVSGGRKLTIQSLWTENTIGYRTFQS